VKNSQPDPLAYIERVRCSDVGRIFLEGRNTNFQHQDLMMSIQVDLFPYLLKVSRDNNRLVMGKCIPG